MNYPTNENFHSRPCLFLDVLTKKLVYYDEIYLLLANIKLQLKFYNVFFYTVEKNEIYFFG